MINITLDNMAQAGRQKHEERNSICTVTRSLLRYKIDSKVGIFDLTMHLSNNLQALWTPSMKWNGRDRKIELLASLTSSLWLQNEKSPRCRDRETSSSNQGSKGICDDVEFFYFVQVNWTFSLSFLPFDEFSFPLSLYITSCQRPKTDISKARLLLHQLVLVDKYSIRVIDRMDALRKRTLSRRVNHIVRFLQTVGDIFHSQIADLSLATRMKHFERVSLR